MAENVKEKAEEKMNINQKLVMVQSELKAPKSQFNKFGNYHYRSLEDIAEAVKPLLVKYGLTLTLDDEIVLIGERYYLRATATLLDTTSDGCIVCHAMAREALDAKGMSDPQLTGSSSSYARKYCLNALFLIDDTKDDDSNEAQDEKQNRANKGKKQADAPAELKYFTEQDIAELTDMCVKAGTTADDFFKPFGGISKCPASNYGRAKAELTKRINNMVAKNG